MMVGKDDDLGLSLSLGGCSTTGTSSSSIPPPPPNPPASTTNRPSSSSFQIPTATPIPFHFDLMMPAASTSTSAAVATTTAAVVPVSYSIPQHNNPFHRTSSLSTTGSWTLDASNPFHLFTADRTSDATRSGTLNTTPTEQQHHHHQQQQQRSFLKGIDVNRLPATTNTTTIIDEADVSSPNSTLSSVGGKRCEREPAVSAAVSGGSGDDERACSRGGGGTGSDDEDGDTSRKKLRLSKDQSAVLEDSFKEHNTLNPKQKLALAKRLGLRPRQVEVWFQNRRARTKLKQTEVECEFLRRCYEQLTEENRRLQKEVQELRALKLSPQFYMQMTPPTTLTMCPSCERVGGGAGGGASTSNKTNSSSRAMIPWGVGVNVNVPSPVPIRSLEPLQPRS